MTDFRGELVDADLDTEVYIYDRLNWIVSINKGSVKFVLVWQLL